jgi:hypothetical protein
MSVINFELKEDHLKLLKHFKWSLLPTKNIISGDGENPSPLGGDNLYDEMDLILHGESDNYVLNDLFQRVYKEGIIEKFDNLLSELPIALEIILFLSTFEVGNYRARWHLRDWSKY